MKRVCNREITLNEKRKIAKYFACSQPCSSECQQSSEPNKLITDKLLILQGKVKTEHNGQWKQIAYRKAISALKKYPFKIKSEKEAKKIRGIGDRIAAKIGEILQTGQLRKAQYSDEYDTSIDLFSRIWGVGISTAQKWYAKGYRNFSDLKNSPPGELTATQKIGLELFKELEKRIPRKEVQKIRQVVRCTLRQISVHLKMVVCGSFRRGKPDCGDIDILITHKKGKNNQNFLQILVDNLTKQGFITHKLTGKTSKRKFMGICRLLGDSQCHRRIDLQFVPREQFSFALLYFTGSDHFNRSMRLLARKFGYSLSDKGLRLRHTWDGTLKGDSLICPSEADIFVKLGLDYIKPKNRNH